MLHIIYRDTKILKNPLGFGAFPAGMGARVAAGTRGYKAGGGGHP